MRTVKITADPAKSMGRPRSVLGMNNCPTITFLPRLALQQEMFRALKPVCVRHHDAPLENAGLDLVDVSRIFPLFRLDENDPANYDFGATDDYFLSMGIDGLPIELRLGESIDHSGHSRRVHPPEDPAKWARICRNIVRHYRDGWADGLHLNVTRLAIWEEPDTVPQLFTGTKDDYIGLFVTAYRILHEAFPDMRIGGPNCCSNLAFCEMFLDRCKAEGIVPGFLSVTCYSRDIAFAQELVRRMRDLLDGKGFADTEVALAEWHLGPYSWGENGHMGLAKNGFDGAENAAYTASSLMRFTDSPADLIFYYAWATGVWGVTNPKAEVMEPRPVYYGLKYYSDVCACSERIAVACDGPDEFTCMAGRTAEGKVLLLVSAYDACAARIEIRVPGCSACRVLRVADRPDDNYPAEARPLACAEDGRFVLEHRSGGSGVMLLELE